jgi:hypothetical protein
MTPAPVELWEILVPTEKRRQPGRYYTTRYHRIWDQKVRAIAGGLTILAPGKGQWLSPAGEAFAERMIPVRIACTRWQIEKIADITAAYYDQLAVMFYRISDQVVIKQYPQE